MSVIEYDASTHELKTLSMHHFEEEELKVRYIKHHSSSVIIYWNIVLVMIPLRTFILVVAIQYEKTGHLQEEL